MSAKIKCLICSKELQFINNTHLKTHGLSIQEYKQKFPDSQIKSDQLRDKCAIATRGKTYEEIYGAQKANELRLVRSKCASVQMKDDQQRYIRRIKCGAPEYYTDIRKKNMSESSTTEVVNKRKNTFQQKLEAGLYTKKVFGRQSVQALKFIEDYINKNLIAESLCYFDKGGISNNEYFVVIHNPITNKKFTAAYDLVVTLDGKHNIQTIIEINGPWHYRLNEVISDPNGRACPLKTNKYTKLESYNIDAMKLNKALELSKEVFIFWLDTYELIKITEPIKLIKNG